MSKPKSKVEVCTPVTYEGILMIQAEYVRDACGPATAFSIMEVVRYMQMVEPDALKRVLEKFKV